MKKIEIAAVPNQEFTATLEDVSYSITIRSADGFMVYDVGMGDQIVVQGFRFVHGELMLPYRYMEQGGNLLLDVPETEEPNYENFGTTQNLFFLTSDEVAQYRANRP